ncbi:MAG: hypothetical protein HeimC3_08740 [Candidatus Heimdallarchaeota archaeon LC_3]|nr:MAG: hypothetical protein HeimC3_08740 [Candidatus Heimdallarchaeota archaeon LC_3]
MSNVDNLLNNFENCLNITKDQETLISNRITSEIPPKIHSFSLKENNETNDMIAVDGTTLWLWKHPKYEQWLILNRTVAVRYSVEKGQIKGNDIIIEDTPFLFSTISEINGSLNIDFHKELLAISSEFNHDHTTIAQGIREYHELSLALKMTKEFPKTIIALDGNLNTYKSHHFESVMNELLVTSQKNENSLVGIVKSNKTHRFLSPETDEVFIERITSKQQQLLYTDLPEESDQENPRYYKIGNSYLARLHSNALKWFRIDVGYSPNGLKSIFSDLANYCSSQELLGYPLPLIDAHQGCISIHKLKEDYFQIMIKVAKKIGFSTNDLIYGFTNFEGRPEGDFHAILDNFTV